MKKTHPEDAALSEILRLRRTTATLPPQFRDAVWRRIEQEETKSDFTLVSALRAWIECALPRPKIALCYVSALLLLGMGSGLWTAQGESHRVDAQLSWRYVQSVDPYQVAALHQ
jgi:hypothetical protein